MHCPTCAARLVPVRRAGSVAYACARCKGRLTTFDVLRRLAGRETLRELLRETRRGAAALPRSGKAQGTRACPVCRERMRVVPVGGLAAVELDVCSPCGTLWADEDELVQLQAATFETAAARPPLLSPEARAYLPDRWWKVLVAAFGVPVETSTQTLRRLPLVTWTVVAVMVIASFLAFAQPTDVLSGWGLLPSDPLRHGGLDWITSFFLHADIYHLASNAYFLVVFGDNVEEHLGHRKMLLLLVLSALLGDLAHLAIDPRASLPLVGASGGISGVLALYALLFPRARITVLLLVIVPLTLPALWMLGLWGGLQLVGAAQQLAGISAVSALAHLGGAAVGFGFWWFLRKPRPAAVTAARA